VTRSYTTETSTQRYDISLLRNRAVHVGGPTVPLHADHSPMHRSTAGARVLVPADGARAVVPRDNQDENASTKLTSAPA